MNIEIWCEKIKEKLIAAFGDKLVLLGLQGSYAREEATLESDIDLVALLTTVSERELAIYKRILSEMPDRGKACGFIAAIDAINVWPEWDLLSLYLDTKVLYGEFKIPLDKESAKSAYAALASGIYHQVCHNYLYEDDAALAVLKSAFFAMRLKRYYDKGEFVRSLSSLKAVSSGVEKDFLEQYEKSRKGIHCDLDINAMLDWALSYMRAGENNRRHKGIT